jgi:hypothetical protein
MEYNLISINSKDIISKIKANSIEEAIFIFSQRKKLTEILFNKLFKVEKA